MRFFLKQVSTELLVNVLDLQSGLQDKRVPRPSYMKPLYALENCHRGRPVQATAEKIEAVILPAPTLEIVADITCLLGRMDEEAILRAILKGQQLNRARILRDWLQRHPAPSAGEITIWVNKVLAKVHGLHLNHDPDPAPSLSLLL
jgi:hypothetical protein